MQEVTGAVTGPTMEPQNIIDADIHDFIGVFDNAVSAETCRNLIQDFEVNHEYNLTFNRASQGHLAKSPGQSHLIDDDAFDYTDPRGSWVLNNRSSSFVLAEDVGRCMKAYQHEAGRGFMGMQQQFFLNTVKVQRTTPRQGYHSWHCEQGSRNFSSRFLFYIAYLNDVEEGGETEFLHYSRRVSPKQGRILIAPASFTHTHRGNPPLSGPKYIATGWLEF